jgi:8-oxo-dGTP pyrophosphatase MutT (NUDIX family)
MNNWEELLKAELAKPLPGAEAWHLMAPSLRRSLSADNPLKRAGILILLYPHWGERYTVFIKRTESKGVHSGQVSFPGGIFENADEILSETALREAVEETGINKSKVQIIGKLTPLHIPASNIEAHPFVGVTNERHTFRTSPNEVQYLIEVKVSDLLNTKNQKKKYMQVAGEQIEVPYFDVGTDLIWGATAMILSEFLEILKKSG